MDQRIDVYKKGRNAIKPLIGLGAYLAQSPIEQPLLNLISFRVSQINGCAYCLDMHSKDLRAGGEIEQRIYVLDAWREAPFYSERERAALAWAEAIIECHVPDEIYKEVQKQFSEEELIDLTLAVTATNSFNHINIAFRAPTGTYMPGEYTVETN